MSLADDVQAVLAADAALVAIFGVQIVTYEALGDLGLNRTGYPSAFDANGELVPIIVIRDRITNATFEMRGENEQIESYLQAIEVVCYASRFVSTNPALLDTALGLIYADLQDRNAGAVRMSERTRVTSQREPLFNFAFMSYSIWNGMGLHTP